jgi:uncharacterized protein (DUF342 family)
MQGVHLKLDETQSQLLVTINTSGLLQAIAIDDIKKYIRASRFASYFLEQTALEAIIAKANLDFESNVVNEYQETIGIAKDAEYQVVLSKDKMSAELIITAPYAGKLHTVAELINICKEQGVNRGLSKKRITDALAHCRSLLPGDKYAVVVAKGLPPKAGQPTTLVQLVPNILERVLRPQINENDVADMRNLGEIVSVLSGTPIARIKPETKGRDGFSVDGKAIKAKPGKKQAFKLDANVVASDDDPNLIVAEKTGMPSFAGNKIKVDDVFSSNGVNVGTGNIDFNGAVVINGDVADKMRIIAKGDVTINGFVESAYIETTGDIVITQGAAGQSVSAQAPPNCVLRAQGNVTIANAQGCDIHCDGDLHIFKQLAFSHVACNGAIYVGKNKDKAEGIVIGCQIVCRGDICAGVIGATSGSHIVIDFSEPLARLTSGNDELLRMAATIQRNLKQHQAQLARLQGRTIPEELVPKVTQLEAALRKEQQLYVWIQDKLADQAAINASLPKFLRVTATNTLHSGVSIKYVQHQWRSEREFGPMRVQFGKEKWQAEPIV